jgi:hypothetical protein
MVFVRSIGFVALLFGSSTAYAAPAPLAVFQINDHSAVYLPEADPAASWSADSADQSSGDPMDDFTRAIGDALQSEQQTTKARCASAVPPKDRPADRMAWEASCRYSRR